MRSTNGLRFRIFGRFILGFAVGILLSSLVVRADIHTGSAAPTDGFSLQLDPSGIPASESAPLQAFVASVQQLIPEGMKAGIGREIRVRFSKMTGKGMTQLAVPACMGEPTTEADQAPAESAQSSPDNAADEKSSDKAKMELLGHDNYSGKASVVDLNSLFIQEILAGPNGTRSYGCGHKNMYTLAEATLIHELAHVYDARLGKQESTKNSYFQKLMGFTKQWSWKDWDKLFLVRSLLAKNAMLLRSPDPYEFKNIKETFAVNMEYFVLDPEFGCRRPSVDHYYRELMGITSQPTCPLDTTVYLNSDNPEVNLKATVNLDPSRIYDIQYLLAAQGQGLMSRWGHAMYRVIVCAPTRKTVGPECLQDVQYHVVLSYRADVSDLMLSYMKGLDGGYPSQLYILPLPDVLNEYNKLELRDLISLPLHLTDEQKQQFVYRTLEQYWEYQGRYYFFTNNCASESLTMLQGIVPDAQVQKLHDMTPLGLESDFTKIGMIDPSLVKDRQSAIEQGYLFASKKPVLDEAYAAISAELPPEQNELDVHNTDDYLNKTSAEQRQRYFDAVMKKLSPAPGTINGTTARVKTAAYFYLLESYISSFDEQSISKKVAGVIENIGDQKRNSANGDTGDGINSDLIETMESAEPWNQLTSGYGIPEPEDFSTQIAQTESSAFQDAYQKFETWMQAHFQSDLGEFQKIQLNLSAFAQAITAGSPPILPSPGPSSSPSPEPSSNS